MKITVSTFLLLLIISCKTPERNCTDFRNGNFEFIALVGGEKMRTTFKRQGSLEIEKFNGVIDSSSVKWVNDCEYILKNLNPKNTAQESPILIKILTTSNTGYTFEYGKVGSAQKARGEAKIIP